MHMTGLPHVGALEGQSQALSVAFFCLHSLQVSCLRQAKDAIGRCGII